MGAWEFKEKSVEGNVGDTLGTKEDRGSPQKLI